MLLHGCSPNARFYLNGGKEVDKWRRRSLVYWILSAESTGEYCTEVTLTQMLGITTTYHNQVSTVHLFVWRQCPQYTNLY